jgi:hypothetical protein
MTVNWCDIKQVIHHQSHGTAPLRKPAKNAQSLSDPEQEDPDIIELSEDEFSSSDESDDGEILTDPFRWIREPVPQRPFEDKDAESFDIDGEFDSRPYLHVLSDNGPATKVVETAKNTGEAQEKSRKLMKASSVSVDDDRWSSW